MQALLLAVTVGLVAARPPANNYAGTWIAEQAATTTCASSSQRIRERSAAKSALEIFM